MGTSTVVPGLADAGTRIGTYTTVCLRKTPYSSGPILSLTMTRVGTGLGHCVDQTENWGAGLASISVGIGSNFSCFIPGVRTGALVWMCQDGSMSSTTAIGKVSPGATLSLDGLRVTLTESSSDWPRAGGCTGAHPSVRRARIGAKARRAFMALLNAPEGFPVLMPRSSPGFGFQEGQASSPIHARAHGVRPERSPAEFPCPT